MNQMNRNYIDRASVAESIGMKTSTFYKKLRGLQEQEGFPPPAFGTHRGARWDPAAIEAWKNSRLPAGLPTTPATPADFEPEDVAISEDWAARLSANIDQL